MRVPQHAPLEHHCWLFSEQAARCRHKRCLAWAVDRPCWARPCRVQPCERWSSLWHCNHAAQASKLLQAMCFVALSKGGHSIVPVSAQMLVLTGFRGARSLECSHLQHVAAEALQAL